MGSAAHGFTSGVSVDPAYQDTRERSYLISAEPECARLTRDLAKAALLVWGLHCHADDVALVVGELFSNACRHGCRGVRKAQVRLILRHERHHLYLGVWDPSPAIPRLAPHDPYAETGRGLRIIAAYAHAHGFEAHKDGKVSWARIAI